MGDERGPTHTWSMVNSGITIMSKLTKILAPVGARQIRKACEKPGTTMSLLRVYITTLMTMLFIEVFVPLEQVAALRKIVDGTSTRDSVVTDLQNLHNFVRTTNEARGIDACTCLMKISRTETVWRASSLSVGSAAPRFLVWR